MNLLLLEKEDYLSANRVRITGPRFLHLKKVIKAKVGDWIVSGDLNGKMGQGRVEVMDREGAELSVCLAEDPPPALPLTLVLALPRPKMLKRILQTVSSMGVKEIYLINSWRVEKSFWSTDLLEPEKFLEHLKLGLAQARDTGLPRVHLRRYFTAFVKEELQGLGQGKLCILAHPKTTEACPVGVGKETVLVLGPEGGFIDLEVETLEAAGFFPVHIGPRILRVETAVPALIARLFTH